MKQHQTLKIQNFDVQWSMHNVASASGVNDSFLKDSNAVWVPYGFYTFSSLKKYLAGEGITIEKTASGNIQLTSDKDLNLKKIGKLLGFLEDKAITKNQKYKSPLPADLLNGLKDIEHNSYEY